jgi:hypothetical protein
MRNKIDRNYGKYIPLKRFNSGFSPSEQPIQINMKDKNRAIQWLCLALMTTAGLKYVPPYLLEQRKLDLQDRVLDLKEHILLQRQSTPTVSLPATAELRPLPQLL